MRAFPHSLIAVLAFAATLAAGPALAQAPAAPADAAAPAAPETATPAPTAIVTRTGETTELSGQGAEMAFVAGGQARVSAQVADDIFAAGGELRIDGAGADHLFALGGEVELSPGTVRDLVAAGARVELRAGVVSDDVVAMGGDLRLNRDARIDGSAVLAGGRVQVEAPVARELMAAGGQVELNGAVGGDARIRGGEIVIGPDARIGGDLYLRGQRIEVSPQAVVEGRTVREIVPRPRHAAESVAAFAVMAALFGLGVLVLQGVIAAAAPRLASGADRRLRSRFWATAGVGALIVLIGPPVLLALLATVIGAPLALFLGLAYLVAMPLAFACIAYWIGQLMRGGLARSRAAQPPAWGARLGWTMLGALALMLVCAIPILGGLAWLLALAAGMGAVAAVVTGADRAPTAAPAAPQTSS